MFYNVSIKRYDCVGLNPHERSMHGLLQISFIILWVIKKYKWDCYGLWCIR